MANDLNKFIVIGRLVRDPELRYTQSGTPVASFSIANSKSWTQNNEKKEQTSFFNCVAWSKAGEIITQYMKKGSQIQITGRLQQRTWEDQSGNKRSTLEVNVEEFQFLGSSNKNTQSESHDHKSPMPDDNPFSDDSIPF